MPRNIGVIAALFLISAADLRSEPETGHKERSNADGTRAVAAPPKSLAGELLFTDLVRQAQSGVETAKNNISENRDEVNLQWGELLRAMALKKRTQPLVSISRAEIEIREREVSRALARLEIGPDALALAKLRLLLADTHLKATKDPKPEEQDPILARAYAETWRYSWRIAVFKAEQADREYGFAQLEYQRALRLKNGIGHLPDSEEENIRTVAVKARTILENLRQDVSENFGHWQESEKAAIEIEKKYNRPAPTLSEPEKKKDELFKILSGEWPKAVPKITDPVKPRARDEGVEARKDRLLKETAALVL